MRQGTQVKSRPASAGVRSSRHDAVRRIPHAESEDQERKSDNRRGSTLAPLPAAFARPLEPISLDRQGRPFPSIPGLLPRSGRPTNIISAIAKAPVRGQSFDANELRLLLSDDKGTRDDWRRATQRRTVIHPGPPAKLDRVHGYAFEFSYQSEAKLPIAPAAVGGDVEAKEESSETGEAAKSAEGGVGGGRSEADMDRAAMEAALTASPSSMLQTVVATMDEQAGGANEGATGDGGAGVHTAVAIHVESPPVVRPRITVPNAASAVAGAGRSPTADDERQSEAARVPYFPPADYGLWQIHAESADKKRINIDISDKPTCDYLTGLHQATRIHDRPLYSLGDSASLRELETKKPFSGDTELHPETVIADTAIIQTFSDHLSERGVPKTSKQAQEDDLVRDSLSEALDVKILMIHGYDWNKLELREAPLTDIEKSAVVNRDRIIFEKTGDKDPNGEYVWKRPLGRRLLLC